MELVFRFDGFHHLACWKDVEKFVVVLLLYAFQLNASTAEALGTLCERYLLYHLDERLTTLEFYHTLFPETDKRTTGENEHE